MFGTQPTTSSNIVLKSYLANIETGDIFRRPKNAESKNNIFLPFLNKHLLSKGYGINICHVCIKKEMSYIMTDKTAKPGVSTIKSDCNKRTCIEVE